MIRTDRFSPIRAALAVLALALTVPTQGHAQGGCVQGGSGGCTSSVPEMDPSLGSGGLALVAGAVMVVRGRRRG
jgi:hypothetical protein